MATPVLPGKQLSRSLKERLRRCGRYYKSPLAPKRLCNTGSASTSLDASPLTKPGPEGDTISENEGTSASSRNQSIANTATSQQLSNPKLQSTPIAPVQSDDTGKSKQGTRHKPSGFKTPRRLLSSSPGLPGHPAVGGGSASNVVNDNTSENKKCTPKRARLDHIASPLSQTHCQDATPEPTYSSRCFDTFQLDSCTSTVPTSHHQDGNLEPSCSDASIKLECSSLNTLKRQKDCLVERIRQKEEKLRKLKMVKLYREKSELQDLESLTSKWRDVTQQAVQHLWALAPEPKPSLTEVVNHFGLEHSFVHYDAEEETFLDP